MVLIILHGHISYVLRLDCHGICLSHIPIILCLSKLNDLDFIDVCWDSL